MIIAEKTKEKVIQSHDFEQVNCTIDAEDMRYVASLLRNNYSNTQLAVVREISANALDANKEANSDRPIEIKLPTQLNSTFVVRDFGGGLSEEDVFGLYSKYGKSTKRDSNNYIGAFGIGKFAPLSYGENFTCVSYHGGNKTTYNIFVNDDDDTKIVRIGDPEPTNEPTGLTIEVAVADSDRENFTKIAKKFFRFFSQDEMPKFIGAEDNFIESPSFSLESANGEWFVLDDKEGNNYYYQRNSHIIMGRVTYPLDAEAINVENFVQDEKSQNIIKELLREPNFYLRVPIGSVKLHHSRESLEYNNSTQKSLCRALYYASQEILDIAKLKLADSEDLWEAKSNHAVIVNSLNNSLRRLFENAFEWNGIKITNARFNREYGQHENLILTEMSKEKDEDARNNFRVKNSKVSSVFCVDGSIFMIQNIKSAHGNNLRARTIFNENEGIDKVYVINPVNQEGWDYLDNEWNFNLIDSKHKLFSDNVEKEKPTRNNVSGGKSRASIPLFKMKTDTSYLYRNADYWANCDNPINSLESDDIEGSIDGKLIYVPITRYTIDIEGWDLDRVSKSARNIRKKADKDSDLSKFVVMGVRKGDVKKLGDNWVSWIDFLVDHYKTIVNKNFSDLSECYIRASMANFSTLNDFQEKTNYYSDLVENKDFSTSEFDDDHAIHNVRGFRRIVTSQSHEYFYVVNFLNHHAKTWLDNKFSSFNVDADEMILTLDKFSSDYPALGMLCSHLGYYNNRDHYSHGDMIEKVTDYIKLCDNNRGEGE